ncbi:hypothetical protein [Xylocopilactobacillus apicola]|uniref:Uncharacterized protein n=1 Tax=Xylocopilactobacillus apicola TaxID=2932184 RepID=A0AAU9CXI4_9LACO|nr:hypothetical protein [Xylocopilactobacillus apicola]BDR58702.1 hypothetical protein XA3_11430 [Xylocopilactobacillus apicola]
MEENDYQTKLKSIPKKTYLLILAAVIVVIGGMIYFKNRKIDLLSEQNVTIKFNGYEGKGTGSVDDSNFRTKAVQTLSNKAGLSIDSKDKLVKALTNDSSLEKSDFSASEIQKIEQVEKWYKNLSLEITPSSNLKNGQKVKLVLSVIDQKNTPIKPASKTYTVKGLKEFKKESTKPILNSIKVKFAGFQGHGVVILTSKKFNNEIFEIKKNGKLINGDLIQINLPDSAFSKEGVVYEGKKYLTAKVSGLKDLSKISNVDELKKFSDDLNENDHPDSIYINKKFIGMYAVPDSIHRQSTAYSDFDTPLVSSRVKINDPTMKTDSLNKVRIVSIYQREYKEIKTPEPMNSEIIIKGLEDNDNNLDLSQINSKEDTQSADFSNTLTIEQHNLEVDGIKLR